MILIERTTDQLKTIRDELQARFDARAELAKPTLDEITQMVTLSTTLDDVRAALVLNARCLALDAKSARLIQHVEQALKSRVKRIAPEEA